MSDLLEASELAVRIGRARPVDGVSFSIAAGECFALVGESGCGKSMTALALMRLLPEAAHLDGGSVRFAGRRLEGLAEREMRGLRGGGLGMIFQEPGTSLNPVLTVGRQIGEAIELHGGCESAVSLLEQVGIPDPSRRVNEYPFQLSGGMKQRVMIAMALAGNPRLLIADEPTTALDVTIQAQVLDLLDRLRRERGMALLLITHDLGVVARLADRVGVMYAGQLVETAPRGAFFAGAAHPYSVRLFAALPDVARRGVPLATIPGSVPASDAVHAGCRFADRCTDALEACRERPPRWRDAGMEHAVRCFLEHIPQAAAADVGFGDTAVEGDYEPLLAVRDLAVHFPIRRGIFQRTVGHVRAVDGLSLDLRAGRTLALVGESGCGKTTVGKAILQLVASTAGTIMLDGNELTSLSESSLRPLRSLMQMVFQDPFASLDPRLSAGEIIAEGLSALGVSGDIGELLEQVGLRAEMAHRYPHEFSGGQRQRIAIARALAVSPRLVVCDEPTSALDVSVQAQILNLLAALQRRLGLAYLFITHNIGVVDFLAHEVAVMYLGRIVERGTTDEVLRTPRHPYTRALLAAVPAFDGVSGTHGMAAGDLPSPADPPSGCHFHPRCPQADERCRREYPSEAGCSATHIVRCHFGA